MAKGSTEETKKLIETAREKIDRGLPLDREERAAFFYDLALKRTKAIFEVVEEVRNKNNQPVLYSQGSHNASRRSIKLLTTEMYLLAALQADKRQALEAEVLQLRKRIIDREERAPRVAGTFDPSKDYRAFDVVALNGASFMARSDKPGPCPGDGWQLSAMQGKRGNPGPRGPSGVVKSLTVDGEGMLTLINADGTIVKCDLYPVLNKVKQA